MKLLFDQNLSFKLCTLLSDLFPDSKPVREQPAAAVEALRNLRRSSNGPSLIVRGRVVEWRTP